MCLAAAGVSWAYDEIAPELKLKMKSFQDINIPLEGAQLERDSGHELICTPPLHSDLQPIELICALVKGNLGLKYCKKTILADVKGRLDSLFALIDTVDALKTVERIIRSTDKVASINKLEMTEED